jgi:hypothetical protein
VGENVILVENVIFTILEGLVTGGSGYLATKVELKEARKENHPRDHKANLKVVNKTIEVLIGLFCFSQEKYWNCGILKRFPKVDAWLEHGTVLL